MLRPLTTLGTAAITITNCGRDTRRIFYDKLKMDGVGPLEEGALTVDLTGRTVSDLVLIDKSLTREDKAAAKSAKDWGDSYTPMTWEFADDAAGYDLKALAKEPTPAEDWVTMRKVRKVASLTGAKWARALELLGLEAEPAKDGRKLIGFNLAFPGIDEEPTLYTIEYGSLAPAGEPHWSEEREDPEGFKARTESYRAHKKAARDWLVSKASDLMGLEDPTATPDGLPTRSRDYRTDLTIRTCPVCFRDIKASSHTGGLMADHGYTITGRGWDGWGGMRRGSCTGTGHLPWEKSCDPAKGMLAALLEHSDKGLERLAALRDGKVTSLTVKGRYDYRTNKYTEETLTAADGRKWDEALRNAIAGTKRGLDALWSGYYGSIPWYRMAIRTWEPVADDHIAIGAPKTPATGEDFAGKPTI
jgi:hypothetical protein